MWNNGTASSSKSSSDNHQHPHRQEKSSLIQIAHHHYHHRYQDHYDTHDFKTKGPLQQQQQQVDHDKNITSHAGSSSTRSRISNGIINNRNNIPLYSNNTVMGRPFSTHHTTSPPKGSKPIKGRPIQQHRIVKKKKSPGKGVVGGSGGGGGGGGREIDNPKTLNETEINYSTATSSTTSTQRKTTRDSIQIFTDRQDDGFSNFVMKTQSVQFKVHRPGCSCTKIQNVMRSIQEENNRMSTPPTDGSSGFIILPNSNTLKNIFVGGRVTSHAYLQDPLVHESDLWDILRPLPQSIYGTIIKLVCAQCMLQVVPNGFVCLSSPSRSLVEDARDMALRAKEQTLESKNVLHSDHADYICVLGLHALKRYDASSSHQRRRSYEKKYYNNLNGLHNMNQDEQQYLILKELLDQNVPVDKSPNNVNLKIGHHLKCIFNFFQGEERDRFVMITVVQTHKQDGTGTVLEMDVPGGKRHLGESSLECAFRETREETSLAMEKSWLLEDGRPLKSSIADESFNAFYQVLPPRIREKKDAALDDILSNVFWTNTGLRS